MAREPSSDRVNFFQVVHCEKQFFASGSRLEDIDGRIDALVTDLPIENHFHIPCTLELLENEFVHL